MKIYTKTGDTGKTSLFGGGRLLKSDGRVAQYGAVDELNSFVGLLRSTLAVAAHPNILSERENLDKFLYSLQNRLFDLGAELATGDEKFLAKLSRRIQESDVQDLEKEIDRMQASLQPIKNFILPGGSLLAAQTHICRTVCRRAERAMVAVEAPSLLLVQYINRLSDYFFVLARYFNHLEGVAEPEWEK